MRAFFISDLHLKDMDEPSSQTLLGFLLKLEGQATHLFLVGDIFDLWIASHEFFIARFKPIVDQIHRLKKSGVEIHYFEGNHDLYLKKFWQAELGIQVHARASTFWLAEKRVRVEHGDLINPDDKGYLFLHGLLRSPIVTWLAHALPSRLVKAIGVRASRASREYTSNAKSIENTKVRELIREHVLKLDDSHIDFLISGHVHVQDDQLIEKNKRPVRGINLGAWFDYPKCFLIADADQGITAEFRRLKSDGDWRL